MSHFHKTWYIGKNSNGSQKLKMVIRIHTLIWSCTLTVCVPGTAPGAGNVDQEQFFLGEADCLEGQRDKWEEGIAMRGKGLIWELSKEPGDFSGRLWGTMPSPGWQEGDRSSGWRCSVQRRHWAGLTMSTVCAWQWRWFCSCFRIKHDLLVRVASKPETQEQ